MSRISVIIPNFNREDLLGQTIANLLSQSHLPHEIIVVDDGSTDGSLEVIRSFGSAIQLLQQKNQGPGAARNAGLALATGDYIQFQDSDDLLSLNKLQAQVSLLNATGADIALGPWAHVFIRDRQLSFETCVLQNTMPPAGVGLPGWMLRGWFTIFQSLMFRRAFLLSVGGYETDVRYGEDMEYFFRLLARSPRVAFAPEVMTLYRVNSANNLSSDGGAPQGRRVIDWARCLQRIGRHQGSCANTADGFSRAIFLVAVRKHLRYLRQVPAAPEDLIGDLAGQISRLPGLVLGPLELWLRLAERMRLLQSGYRWMPGLQAGKPTGQQIQQIKDLGFKVDPPGVDN
jgi:GT2 family glycosyltransferase